MTNAVRGWLAGCEDDGLSLRRVSYEQTLGRLQRPCVVDFPLEGPEIRHTMAMNDVDDPACHTQTCESWLVMP